MAGTPTTRRAFLRKGVILAGGSTLVAACAGRATQSRAGPAIAIATTSTRAPRPTIGAPEAPSGLLRVSNRPGSIGSRTVRAYELATGVTVDYTDDIADDAAWLSGHRAALARHDDIGSDLDVLADATVSQLVSSGLLAALDADNVPNRVHLRTELAAVAFDRNRRHSLPWMAGMAGIAYDPTLVGKPVTGVGALLDPQVKGRVTMLADLRDGLGMVMMSQGHSPAQATTATVAQAVDLVRASRDVGQFARFTGNDDFADLISGAMVMAQVRSGDMARLRAANPRLQFVVPDSGSTLFAQNMVAPRTTRNQVAAESWMNWIYEPANYAALLAQVRGTGVLSGLGDELARIDRRLADDPLVDPPAATLASLAVWAPLEPAEQQRLTALYAEVTG